MQRRQQSGFTLLEVVIAAGILSIALAGAAMVSRTGNEAHETGAATQALERVAHGALEKVASELARTSADSLEPDPVEGLAYSAGSGGLSSRPNGSPSAPSSKWSRSKLACISLQGSSGTPSSWSTLLCKSAA